MAVPDPIEMDNFLPPSDVSSRMSSPIADLPEEILILILEQLGQSYLFENFGFLLKVCRDWRRIVKDLMSQTVLLDPFTIIGVTPRLCDHCRVMACSSMGSHTSCSHGHQPRVRLDWKKMRILCMTMPFDNHQFRSVLRKKAGQALLSCDHKHPIYAFEWVCGNARPMTALKDLTVDTSDNASPNLTLLPVVKLLRGLEAGSPNLQTLNIDLQTSSIRLRLHGDENQVQFHLCPLLRRLLPRLKKFNYRAYWVCRDIIFSQSKAITLPKMEEMTLFSQHEVLQSWVQGDGCVSFAREKTSCNKKQAADGNRNADDTFDLTAMEETLHHQPRSRLLRFACIDDERTDTWALRLGRRRFGSPYCKCLAKELECDMVDGSPEIQMFVSCSCEGRNLMPKTEFDFDLSSLAV